MLDPFFGTGTVGAVAERLGRDWLGIELNARLRRARRAAARHRGGRHERLLEGCTTGGRHFAFCAPPQPSTTRRSAMTKAQQVYERIDALVAGGHAEGRRLPQRRRGAGKPVKSLQGAYYQHSRKANGGSTRPRKRETTTADALGARHRRPRAGASSRSTPRSRRQRSAPTRPRRVRGPEGQRRRAQGGHPGQDRPPRCVTVAGRPEHITMFRPPSLSASRLVAMHSMHRYDILICSKSP